MNKADLFIMKCGFKVVYDRFCEMDVTEDGTPYIKGSYIENCGDKWTNKAFLYINDRWIKANYRTLKPLKVKK